MQSFFVFLFLLIEVHADCSSDFQCVSIWECKHAGDLVFPCNNNENKICCATEKIVQRSSILFNHTCGVFSNADKITGGTLAAIGQFPWMALLGYKQTGVNFVQYLCGGSIISDRYILTAAHCISIGSDFQLEEVRLGELNLETPIDCEGKNNDICADPPVDIPIQKVTPHPNYNNKSYQNDIALIRLKSKIKFTPYIQPICLPFDQNVSHELLKDQRLTVSGWGKTDSSNLGGSSKLQYAFVTVWNHERCKRSVPPEVKPIRETQVCANGDKREDACKGDSGGPLINSTYIQADIRGLQIGIVSFASAQICGNPELPTVYTKVDQFLTWIVQNVE